MANQFKDDKMTIIDRDIDKIRVRPTMYISALGYVGCLHLCKEIVDNNRDECFKKESPGNTIKIKITNDYIIASDNGRGIPTNLLRVIHETNQAGSNMVRAHGTTAGENGTGSTAVVAMAKELIVTTLRPTEKKKLTLVYNEGNLKDEILEDYNGKESGLTTKFTPSKKILGTSGIPVEQLIEWLENFHYTLPSSIKMMYEYKGENHLINHIPLFKYFDNTISDDKRLCDPVMIECDGSLLETVMEKEYQRTFHIDAAVMYSSADYHGDDIRKSWMNMIYTEQNGMHVNGVINGLVKYLSEKVLKKKKALEDDDLRRDVLSHLHIVVRATCDLANMFDGQAKGHVYNKALLNAITSAIYDKLSNMSQTRINELVDIVIQNNRVRREGEKARSISSTSKMSKAWTKPKSFIPCSSAKTVQPKELYLVEGNSAGGGLRGARDPMFQAILMFRGKSLNVWDEELDRVLKSEPWLNLVHVLGCGIGPTFDLKKCNFERIIIATDADIDGYHIRVGFCAFFLKFMPQIIENGMLYISEPPLYKLIQNKEVSYVASQKEYIEACINSIGDMEISFQK